MGVDKEHDYSYLSDLFLQWFLVRVLPEYAARPCSKYQAEKLITRKGQRVNGFRAGLWGLWAPGLGFGGFRALELQGLAFMYVQAVMVDNNYSGRMKG